MKIRKISGMVVAASLIAAPAAAKEWEPVGGWKIAEEGPVDCSLRHDMAKGRSFRLLVRTHGAFRFDVLGLKAGEEDYGLGVDGRPWRHSFDLSEAETQAIFEGLTGGRQLELRDGQRIVDRIQLKDSAAAIERLRLCAAALEAQLAGEIASGKLVLQPRQTELARFPRPAVRAEGELGALFSPADYPEWEKGERNAGATGFRVEVKPDGRAGNCTVTSSSGSDVLDIATCRIIQTRARFTPARDENGKEVADVRTGRLTWVLPEPPA